MCLKNTTQECSALFWILQLMSARVACVKCSFYHGKFAFKQSLQIFSTNNIKGQLSFQSSSGYFFKYSELILETEEKRKTQKPNLSKGIRKICSDYGKHQGISAVLLYVEVHSQLQTAHNLSCCFHGAVKKNNMWISKMASVGQRCICIGEKQMPTVSYKTCSWSRPIIMTQPKLGNTMKTGLVFSRHAETFPPEILCGSLKFCQHAPIF